METQNIDQVLNYYFDKSAELKTYEHNLTHWEQTGKLQYITFRLADSLPQVALDELRRLKEKIQNKGNEELPIDEIRKLKRMSMQRIEYWLEQGFGSCVLRRHDVRKIIEDSFDFVKGRCMIPAYVIMPNHIHLLILCNDEEEWSSVIGSVRRHSAKEINKLLGRKGNLWQKEPYNRVVRDWYHFCSCLIYIHNNPQNLPSTDFSIHFDQQAISHIRHHDD